MKGYLINLKNRSDRLQRFKENVEKYLPNISIELVEAVDGKKLNLNDKEFRKNVNEWNFKNLNDKCLRGVIGCCLSHLECYKKMIDENIDKAIIFEDDCYFINGKESNANLIIKNIKFPEKFGIIWLNKWGTNNNKSINGLRPLINGQHTTESYIISKEFAKILYDNNINNIGAIDAHISQITKKYPIFSCFTLDEDLFIQYNRADSDIR